MLLHHLHTTTGLRAIRASHFQRSLATHATTPRTPQTLVEKIVQNYAVDLPSGKRVRAGDYVMVKPEHVMTHDNTGPVISKFLGLGCSKMNNVRQPVFTLDHDVQNQGEVNQRKYARIRQFAADHGVDFYPAGRGIGHQIMVEEGYAWPGMMVVASDSHSNHYGGVGCLGTAIVRTDAAGIWATGKFWWQIPRIVKVELKGRLAEGVTGKDVIVALAGNFNKDEVLNAAIEFVGDGVQHLSVDERLTIANMTTEWGAVAGVFPQDDRLKEWYEGLAKRAELQRFLGDHSTVPSTRDAATHPRLNSERVAATFASKLSSDPDAHYSSHLTLDLSTLVPYVSGPNSVKVATPLPRLADQNIKIDKAYLVSCTNSRASDIKAAADVLRGQKIAPGVEFYIAAASSVVQSDAEVAGDWQALVDAGAKTLPAGCGPCIGLGVGLLEKGQVGISATNRNYKGRMGSPDAIAYLASPAVVAASALAGKIAGPPSMNMTELPQFDRPRLALEEQVAKITEVDSSSSSSKGASQEELMNGFPARFTGRLLFAPQDNLTTDGMYPGKYTYQDDITPERQAEVVMENYDPSFASIAAQLRNSSAGAVLVSGYNFGTGSSREQAATAIKHAGIPLVIAGSFGDIFKRNAINNGLICVECPELVSELTKRYAKEGVRGQGGNNGELTIQPGWTISVDSLTGEISVKLDDGKDGQVYKAGNIGKSVQELWVNGGLEGFIKASL